MRLISAILAILVMFLTVQPVCGMPTLQPQADACCSGGCTEEKKDSDADQGEHKQDCGICNPFQSCACCAGYIFTAQASYGVPTLSITYTKAKWGQRTFQLIEAPLDGFWQPPK